MANTSINTIYFASGLSGFSGASGASGTSGASGASGYSGTSGTSGVSGSSGTSGTSGYSGVSGTSGAQGTAGADGPSSADAAYGLKFIPEDRANTTTLANDADLNFPVGALEIWRFEFLLKMNSASATPDYKLSVNTDFTLGTGTFGALFTFFAAGNATLSSFAILSTLGADAIETFGSAPDNFVLVEGFIDTKGTGGNVYLQWTQNTSNATPVTMQSDSHVMAHRMFALGPISELSAGSSHSASITDMGLARTWGDAGNGCLGNNSTSPDRSRPASIIGEHVFDKIASGTCNCGLKSDGTAWTWGLNTFGNLGDNSTTTRSSPVSVVGSHSFADLGSASNLTTWLKADGTCWVCGPTPVGDNTGSSRSSPTSVAGNHSFIKVVSGFVHALGLKSDGSLWGWGQNSSGQVGNNTTTNVSSPVSVTGSHLFVEIAAEGNSSRALKSDGTCWAWGANTNGLLGDNSATTRSSPVSVVGNHSFVRLGYRQSASGIGIMMKSDGSVWTCGNGTNGVLGNNSTTSRSSPVSVVGAHSFTSVSGGGAHVLALKSDGTMWAWGDNITTGTGMLGDRTTTNRSSPVLVG